MDKHPSKIQILILFLILALAGGLFYFVKKSSQPPAFVTSHASESQPAPEITTLDSPDGKFKLTMKKDPSVKGSVTYSFNTSSGIAFSKTVSDSVTMSIPFNSWSPDNKYIFIQESGNPNNYYVLPLNLNVTEKFKEKLPNFKLKEVTGWASPTLLIVNTSSQDGRDGPSFWFDLTSQSFIQLSSKF